MVHLSHDLHAHSTASDGTLTPSELVARARNAGLAVLALTDHDSLEGLPEARGAAEKCGLKLVNGVEVSVTWRGQTVHIIGLRVDPANPALLQGLSGLRAFRDWRAQEIARRLERHGIPAALEGAKRFALGSIVSRTHFARYIVERGGARDIREVFKHYLVNGRPGHVPGQWAELRDAIEWIRAAGGQAIVAHPARYRLSSGKLRELLRFFKDWGGEGIEVISGSHSRDDTLRMAAEAHSAGLLASAGSDYHGPEKPWVELGALPQLPAGCNPVWELWG